MEKFPIENKLYFTKNGVGDVIPFNNGIDFRSKELVVLPIVETDRNGIFICDTISRKREHICETPEEAGFINY
jgi:hypothetical protein